MIFVTADTHGSFSRFKKIKQFCKEHNTTTDDVMIILGDSGINYYEDKRDVKLKKYISKIPITFFCIHGNHEQRPYTIKTYKNTPLYWSDTTKRFHSPVYKEEEFPNILFAWDNTFYHLQGEDFIVYGGGYSVDKDYRLAMQVIGYKDYKYWENELPTEGMIDYWKHTLYLRKMFSDNPIILTHTCPKKYLPYEAFLPNIDQSTVDNSLEEFLDYVEENVDYKAWYCGHFHINKQIDKVRFVYDDIVLIKE